MRATAATFKLGISFENWGLKGDHYIHSFGRNGKPTWMCEFHNFWLRSLELGVQSELGDYCFELQAAKAGKFGISQQVEVNFAYHFDASQYAKFLRRFAEGFGIKRVEGKIKEVKQNATTGFIESLVLHSGHGDRRRSVHRLHRISRSDHRADAEDRIRRLVALAAVRQRGRGADRADRAPRRRTRVPSRTTPAGAGAFHCSIGSAMAWCSAADSWPTKRRRKSSLNSIDGKPLTMPRVLKFQTGRRRQVWNKNCVALGSVQWFHRAAGVDQHSSDDGGRHAPAAPVPVRRRSPGRGRSVQRSGAHRDGKDARFRRAPLPRDATR